MEWKVQFSKKALKQISQLKENLIAVIRMLIVDLQEKEPFPGVQWPNYGKLYGKKQKDKRHCHLLKGRPTYVCCWEVYTTEKIIEVYYVGSHEKAPY